MSDITVSIEKMTFGGAGLGHAGGKACFVPFTAPGDVAKVRVRSEKRSYLEGEVIDILEPSPVRVMPPCSVFGTCGGCNWQHLSYPAQLEEKQKIFADIMWRSGRVVSECILPILPAPEPYGYRARVQLKVRYVAGELLMGFYRGGSHFVVDLPGNCAIAHRQINCLVPELQHLTRLFPEPDKVPQIDVTVGDNGSAAVIFHYIGNSDTEAAAFLSANRALLASASGCYLQTGRKTTLRKIFGPEKLEYLVPRKPVQDVPGRRLTFSPGGFSQINYRQNLALIATVSEWAGLSGKERLLDLYCGNGNFSIPLAAFCREVLGLEEYEPSIRDALHNCRINGLRNIRFHCTDALEGLKNSIANGDTFDSVLLDPPRTGAAELVRLIPALKPAKILYVSCDPPTLARDVGILRGLGYAVTKSLPVDMFPQTYHIESITLLEPDKR